MNYQQHSCKYKLHEYTENVFTEKFNKREPRIDPCGLSGVFDTIH